MFAVTLFGVTVEAFCKYSCRFLLICAVLASGAIECKAQRGSSGPQDLKQIIRTASDHGHLIVVVNGRRLRIQAEQQRQQQ